MSNVKNRHTKSFWSRIMRWYKPARARKERARLREELSRLVKCPLDDIKDREDYCGGENCDVCSIQIAPETGPKRELNRWNDWEID